MPNPFMMGGSQGDLLSSTKNRSQTVVQQQLQGVVWGQTNNKPAIDTSYKNKNYNLDNPFTRTSQIQSSIPPQARSNYSAPQQPIDPRNSAIANQYLDNIHAVNSQSTTGIEKANHDDMHAQGQQIFKAVENGEVTPDEAMEHVRNSSNWQANPMWAGGIVSGLALMAGRDPLEAYQMAQKESQGQATANQMMQSIPELEKQFTTDSIQAAITNKDRSLLVRRTRSLEEQEARDAQLHDQQRQEQLQDQERQDERQKANFEQQFKMQSLREDQQQAKAEAKSIADAEKADKTSFNKEVTQFQAGDRKNNTMFSSRITTFNAAENALHGINDPKISTEEKQAKYVNALEQMYKGINPSSSAQITMEDLEHLAGIQNVFTMTGNKLSTKLTGAPLDAAIKQVEANLKVEKESTTKAIQNNIYQAVDNHVAAFGDVDRALKVANVGQNRSKATKEGYEAWLAEQSGEAQEQPANTGALTEQPAPKRNIGGVTSGESAPSPKVRTMRMDSNGNFVFN